MTPRDALARDEAGDFPELERYRDPVTGIVDPVRIPRGLRTHRPRDGGPPVVIDVSPTSDNVPVPSELLDPPTP